MDLFKPFRSKKKSVINTAIEEKNQTLDDIYNWQNNQAQVVVPKKKKKK